MTEELWWEADDGRLLEWELHALEQAGIAYEVDEDFKREHRVLRLRLRVPVPDGSERRMSATYPDSYPWFRPVVVSPDDELGYHQGPFDKQLCFLDRPAAAWNPGSDTLAFLLTEQLRKVYDAQDPATAAELEVPQAEPSTAWYDYWPVGAFVVDGSWDLSGADCGTFQYVLLRAKLDGSDDPRQQLVGVVLSVTDEDGHELAGANPMVRQRYEELELEPQEAQWVRRDRPIPADPSQARHELTRDRDELRHVDTSPIPGSAARAEVVGVVFPIEAEHRGVTADAWTFLVTIDPPGTRRQRRAEQGPSEARHRSTRHVRGLLGGRTDLAVRVPELQALARKTVAVVGLGGVGAPSVLEFARTNLGGLRLLDHDVAAPATSVRHPLGFVDAGRLKVAGLVEHLAAHHPLVDVRARAIRIGAARLDGGDKTEQELLGELLNDADLIYDATGDHGLGLFLCDLAFRHGIPYVSASTSLGAWGGRIAIFRPDQGPCYECLLSHLRDQDVKADVPIEERLTPPASPMGEIQPIGCADVTFTGAGFDIAQVALAGTRLAVSALCRGSEDGYPAPDWNLAVIRFRDEEGMPLAGAAQHHELSPHPDCGECARRAA